MDKKIIEELRKKHQDAGWYCTEGTSWSKYPPPTREEMEEYHNRKKRENFEANLTGGLCATIFFGTPVLLHLIFWLRGTP